MVDDSGMNVAVNGKLLEEVECISYLKSHVAVDRGIAGEVKVGMKKVGKVYEGMKNVFKCR